MCPTYLAECPKCGLEKEYFEKIKDHKKTPKCACGTKMKQILNAPMVAPMFQEYRALGIPGKPWIRTKAEHIATLKRHNKVEVGNDTSMMPMMSDGEFQYQKQEQLKEIERDFETIKEAEKLLVSP